MKRKLLSSDWLPTDVIDFLKEDFDITCPEKEVYGSYSEEDISRLIPDFDVLLLGGQRVAKGAIDRATKLRAICRSGAGCDGVDYIYAGSKGIAVINTPHAVTHPTAELTIGLMLDTARNISYMDRRMRQEKRCCDCPSFINTTAGLYGKTLGIIGFGRIGKAVAGKAAGLGMQILYSDVISAPKEVEESLGAKKVSLEELLRTSDFVTLHCPFVPENLHLINAERLAMMKPTAFLINASRGKMVDEAALVAALKNNTIRGAGLDVYEFEPKVNDELFTMDNVVLSPHAGTWVYEARAAMIKETMTGARIFLKGEMPPNLFNGEYLVKK